MFLYGSAAAWPDASRVQCDYCARRQTLTADGNCIGCGAPLPEPTRYDDLIEVTTFGDRKPQFIRRYE